MSGQIIVEGEPLPDGAVVTVLARDQDETFELDATPRPSCSYRSLRPIKASSFAPKTFSVRSARRIERFSVAFTPRASREVAEAKRWWRANRTKAPNALEEELRTSLDLISATPGINAVARNIALPECDGSFSTV